MDEVAVSTVMHLPPAEIYEFLVDFEGYAEYSKHLERVHADGDGSAGTRYALRFAWWKITYTAHSEVTELDPPSRIDWRLTQDLDARGYWKVEELAEPPADVDTASRVSFVVQFDPDSVSPGLLDLPRFVSLSWVIEKVKPLVQDEAERVVERIVADLEGESRPVDLTIHTTPDSI